MTDSLGEHHSVLLCTWSCVCCSEKDSFWYLFNQLFDCWNWSKTPSRMAWYPDLPYMVCSTTNLLHEASLRWFRSSSFKSVLSSSFALFNYLALVCVTKKQEQSTSCNNFSSRRLSEFLRSILAEKIGLTVLVIVVFQIPFGKWAVLCDM